MAQVILSGLGDLIAALASQAEAIAEATEAALDDAAALLAEQTAELLSLTGHAPGTPTPSAPGEPPSQISGALTGSIVLSPVSVGGMPGVEVGPTTVYGRIQELGGTTGRRYTSVLPPRPYLAPALDFSMGPMSEIFVESWADSLSD